MEEMAGWRVHGGSNMALLLQSGGISPAAVEGLLSSSFNGSRTMVSFEDSHEGTNKSSFHWQVDLEETGDDNADECFHRPEKKMRLTADKVQLLERSFEMENKLGPERKVQLAKELGLQPRQVAIWFQNRRARWKTKQLEKDYKVLKSSYDNLKADYDNLLKEEEKLKAEVTLLTRKLLLKEKAKNNSETPEPKNQMLHQQVIAKPDPYSTPEVQYTNAASFSVGKQEDISSTGSAVFASDSPHHSDGGRHSPLPEPAGSSAAFEQEHADLSHVEKDEEEKIHHFPKLEDRCNYVLFPVEDHPFWF